MRAIIWEDFIINVNYFKILLIQIALIKMSITDKSDFTMNAGISLNFLIFQMTNEFSVPILISLKDPNIV